VVHPGPFQNLEKVAGQISLGEKLEESLERGNGFPPVRDGLQASSEKLWGEEVMD
jgi:hypothetical protein